jgi:hypothetical protein
MARSHKWVFVTKRLDSKSAGEKAWVMLFKHLWIAASLLLTLAILCSPKFAVAGILKMDEDDPRIDEPRGEQFIDLTRELDVDKVYVTVRPEVGHWSQGIGCPEGDKPFGISVSGEMIIRVPGGLMHYETADRIPDAGQIEFGNGDRKWYVAGLMYGSKFRLICPLREELMSTRYLGIDRANSGGLIPTPRCEIDGEREVCYVLGLKFKSRLADEGWKAEHSIEGHQDLVRRYNARILSPSDEVVSQAEEQVSQPVEESATEIEQPQQVAEESARQQELAVAQRMDEDDPRIDAERGETFVRVMRTTKGNKTIVTAKAPLGYWTQRLDGCPEGDRPNGVRLSGHVLFRTESPLAYYEVSESSVSRTSSEYLKDVLTKGNWRITGLADSSYVILDCPRRAESMSTEYTSIESPNDEGLIHQPKCQIESGQEVCFVLGLNLISELAENGWTTYHSVEGHSELVDRYNQHVRSSGQGGPYIQNKMRFAKINAMLWYISYFISIMMCVIVFRNWM